MRVVITPFASGLILLALGVWLLLKQVFFLHWFFTAGSLAVLAIAAWVAFLIRRERGYLVIGWLLGAWAAYAAVDGLLLGLLPGALWFVFMGLGFLIVYALHTRPNRWPLLPGSILLVLGVVLYVMHVVLRWMFVLFPLLLVAWGVWTIVDRRRRKDTGGWE